jgi:hypothetical protein
MRALTAMNRSETAGRSSAGNAKFGTVRPGEKEGVGSTRIIGARVAVIVCAWEEDGLVGSEPPTRICMRGG